MPHARPPGSLRPSARSFHHAAHLANVLWAAHVTHHSSNDYNFAAGSRTSPVEILVSRCMQQ